MSNHTSNDLEQQLREALQRVDPRDGFAERVMARIEGEQVRRPSRLPARSRWLPVSLAASAIFGTFVIRTWQVHQERQGLEARQQLIDALRVTGKKLDLAYRVVNTEARSTAPDDAPVAPPDDKGV